MTAMAQTSTQTRANAWRPDIRAIEIPEKSKDVLNASHDLRDLVDTLGVTTTAKALGVSKGLISQINAGATLTQEVARRASDLRYVLVRALSYFYPDEIGPWLTGPEPLLGGSIPINVLVLKGVQPVVDAIDAIRAGVYA